MHKHFFAILAAAILAPNPAASQATSVAGPVRQLAPAIATSSEALGSLAALRQLSNGNVLVNDQVSRRVLLLDSTLKLVGVIADSTPTTNNAYGGRSGGLFAYRGDTSIFVDQASLSMLVIEPSGKIVRTLAAPRPNEIGALVGGNQASPGFDSRGRLVYRGGRTVTPPAKNADPVYPDTNALVRVDLATRKLDTVSFFKVQKTLVNVGRDAQGNINRVDVQINNVLPTVDEWVVMSDGTAAIVRGRDYRVDFFDADNAATRGAKIPFDWEHLSDELKVTILDSTRAFRERARAQQASGTPPAPGETRIVETRMSVVDGVARSGAAPAGATLSPIVLPDVSELPDYRPAFGVGGVRADRDNRIWVRTTAVLQSGGGAIYDVIDRSGKRVDRVQVPVGVTIAGFGQNGVVYYAVRDESGIHLKKSVLRSG